MTASAKQDWMAEAGFKLAECRHDDPFSILGPHPLKKGFALRVWMPEALEVSISFQNKNYKTENPNHKKMLRIKEINE